MFEGLHNWTFSGYLVQKILHEKSILCYNMICFNFIIRMNFNAETWNFRGYF